MSQTPRDACEAALALGGTRWGMITDVVLPFSAAGSSGHTARAEPCFGRDDRRGLRAVVQQPGESGDLGPGGSGSIARQIAGFFTTSNAQGRSELPWPGSRCSPPPWCSAWVAATSLGERGGGQR